jgi:hypothetical protein
VVRLASVSVLIVLAACSSTPDPRPFDPFDGTCPTEDPTLPQRPAPSGARRVIYSTTADGRSRLWLRDLDATAPEPVRLDGIGDEPSILLVEPQPFYPGVWAPDGAHIAVRTELAPGQRGIGVIHVSSPGSIVNVSGPEVSSDTGFFYLDGPNIWSPTGDRLMWNTLDALWVVNADGTGRRRLVDGPGTLTDARWSSDGSRIAVSGFTDDSDWGTTWVTPSTEPDPRVLDGAVMWWGPAAGQLSLLGAEFRQLDLDARVETVHPGVPGDWPTLTSDGAWLMAPARDQRLPRFLHRGCGDPASVTEVDALPFRSAWNMASTADAQHFAFSIGNGDSSEAWAADRTASGWSLRRVHVPTTPAPRVDYLTVSTTGSRAAWLAGWLDSDRLVVTEDGVQNAREVVLGPIFDRSYWLSPDLRRVAYRAETAQGAVLRVVGMDDPSAPVTLGELAITPGRQVSNVTWSPDSSAFGYYTEPLPLQPFPIGQLFLVEVGATSSSAPIELGYTAGAKEAPFHWQP